MEKDKKYFVISDTHSFFTIVKKGLDKAGFDLKNENHILILCGDLFDRGDETLALYKFIKKIPKERRILVRGNHEYLLKELVTKNAPEKHDFSNGTVKTLFHLVNKQEDYKLYKEAYYWNVYRQLDTFRKIKNFKKVKDILDWIDSDEWVNYYELDNYIFVHAFIPLKNKSDWPAYYVSENDFTYNPKWRTESTGLEFEDSTWGCPYKLFNYGHFNKEIKKGKILVVGHWHTSDFHAHYEENVVDGEGNIIVDQSQNFTIYKGSNLIALDACTAYSHSANVLVLEDNKITCYNSEV